MGDVRVGVGVILKNSRGGILTGKRKNTHGPYYSIPGGHLEEGESFEECALREVFEETGLIIPADDISVIGITNDLITFKESGRHYVSVILFSDKFSGDPELKEPDKCEGWIWTDPYKLPEPHFEASRNGIYCYLNSCFYHR